MNSLGWFFGGCVLGFEIVYFDFIILVKSLGLVFGVISCFCSKMEVFR